ncbi:AMP-binding protein [candidate division WOR-3 bacterium]|nr:AMP-binding protein [candidate division WOR-3 bacterium]
MKEWRLIYRPNGDTADIFALPAAIAEGNIASPYLLSAKKAKETVIIQGVGKKGILAGADVSIDKEEAEKQNIEIATTPRSGRGGSRPLGTISYQELTLKTPDEFLSQESDSESPACILYTSGTTGKPKGVMLSHKNFITECKIMDGLFEIKKEDRIIAVLPLFHVFGLTNVLLGAFYHSASAVLVPQYTPSNLIKAIVETEATVMLAIPTMYTHLLKKRECPSSLRICISGAAALPPNLVKKFEEKFKTRLVEGYGLTESTSASSLNPPEGVPKPGSIGLKAPGIEMKVFDENNNEVKDGEMGEIVIKGDTVMKGYHNLSDETGEALKDGWLHTGDLGYRDSDGYFYITDRKKEIIIKGGLNISPREVEDVIMTHPNVKEVAVLGISEHEREEIKAFVVAEGTLTEKEIIDFCRERLSSFKVPKYVEFRDILPKSLVGKVLKKELIDGYKDERLIEEKK